MPIDVDLESLSRAFAFDDCCRSSFEEALAALHVRLDSVDAEDGEIDNGSGNKTNATSVAKALSHGSVAPALAEVARTADARTALTALARDMSDSELGVAVAGGLHLQAVIAEWDADVLTSAARCQTALTANPNHGPSAQLFAQYQFDRGNLAGAIDTWTLDGVQDPPALATLRAMHDTIRSRFDGVGRNDPCPCGSGPKYKACCLVDPKMLESDRFVLLEARLGLFGSRPHRSEASEAILSLTETEPMAAINFETGIDVLHLEGGLITDYLLERGPLLPPEERALVEQLITNGRDLYAVVADADPSDGLTLRSVRHGHEVALTEEEPAGDGLEFLLARLVTFDETVNFVREPLVINPSLVDDLVALMDEVTEPVPFLEGLREIIDRTPILNMKAEPIVVCTTVWDVSGREADVSSWMEQALVLDAEGRYRLDPTSFLGDDFDPAPSFELRDGELLLGAMSLAVSEAGKAAVAASFGELPLEREEQVPLREVDLRESREAQAEAAAGAVDGLSFDELGLDGTSLDEMSFEDMLAELPPAES